MWYTVSLHSENILLEKNCIVTTRTAQSEFIQVVFLGINIEPRSARKIWSERSQHITFCRVTSVKLTGYIDGIAIVDTVSECVLKCVATSWCYSLNYNTEYGFCELNRRVDILFPSDVARNLSSSNLFLSSMSCQI